MTYPAVLQLYANKLTRDGSHYRNVVKLWERILASADKGLAGDIKRDTNKSMLSDKLYKRIEAVGGMDRWVGGWVGRPINVAGTHQYTYICDAT